MSKMNEDLWRFQSESVADCVGIRRYEGLTHLGAYFSTSAR